MKAPRGTGYNSWMSSPSDAQHLGHPSQASLLGWVMHGWPSSVTLRGWTDDRMPVTSLPFLRLIGLLFLVVLLSPAGLRAHDSQIAVYSAASLNREVPVAPNSIAIAEGEFAESTTHAPGNEPQLVLDTVAVEVEGSDGVSIRAAIFSVEPTRLRFLVPNLPAGNAHLTVRRGSETIADGNFDVQAVSPGLFSAAGSGGGLADGHAEIVDIIAGVRHEQDLAYFDDVNGTFRPIPLNPAAAGTVLFLRLRGTGIRFASSLEVTVGGVVVPATCRNEQGMSAGEDEVRVGPLPVQLVHSEIADVELTADGIVANTVQVSFTDSGGTWVTFSNQVSRLFQEHCQICHHPGEVAPFSLMNYSAAKEWAPAIKQAVEERTMPPWKPVAGHGEFLGERRLTDGEIELISTWVDLGAPEGNRADLPEPLEFDINWTLGEPDLILETPRYTPAIDATDDYRCFSLKIPESITESVSIIGMEVRPGNRKIAHHMILYGDPVGESVGREAATQDGRPGYECFGSANISFSGFTPGVESYFLGLWAPGGRPLSYPEGIGLYLRRGSHVVVQMHYHPDGTEQSDTTRIGLYLADQRTPQNVTVVPVLNTRFVIPPGAKRHEVTASFSLSEASGLVPRRFLDVITSSGVFPVDIINVAPHMHLLGREIRMDKLSSSGERTPMIYIDDWEFDWQDQYTFKNPVKFHLTDRMEVSAIYDNSAENPRNPNNPPIAVRWGDRTVDEMCIVFFSVVLPDLCTLSPGLCASH